MTARPKGGRRRALVLGAPKRMGYRNAANEAIAKGQPCPFCGAAAADRLTGETVDVLALRPGAVVVAVMEHDSYCPAGAS